jgi:hypothetical protein
MRKYMLAVTINALPATQADGTDGMARRRTAEEVEQVVEQYRASGMT